MLNIEQLKLHLPADMQNRAANIAQMVSESLASQVFEKPADLNNITVNSILLSPGETDRFVAQKIATEIVDQIRSQL